MSATAEDYAFSRLLSYCKYMWPEYKVSGHHRIIAQHLEAVESNKISRLIITMPPRAGKSMLVSEFFPSWYLGRNPSHQLITTTYSGDKAVDTGRKIRNQLLEPEYSKIFPDCKLSSDSKGAHKLDTTKGGVCVSVGIGGAIVGRGAHCLTGDTIIETNYGSIKIQDLVDKNIAFSDNLMVLSWNEGRKLIEKSKIVATRKSINEEIYTIQTDSGDYIRSTGEHRFFIPEVGYRKAKNLREGDKLCKISKEYTLPFVWRGKEYKNTKGGFLQKMFSFHKKSNIRSRMLLLWEKISQKTLRIKKNDKKWTCRSILFSKMFTSSPCNKKQEEMCSLWKSCWQKNKKILFRRMQKTLQNTIKRMSFLPEGFYSYTSESEILFYGLQKQLPFKTNAWNWKFQLSPWKRIYYIFQKNKTDYCTKGWLEVCELWWKKGFTCTPYKSFKERQSYRKFNNPMQVVPYNTPQVTNISIKKIEREINCKHYVYDIQVEKNNNFFANKILTHNCFLIDDPLKSREDADSPRMRERLINWFKGVAYTRLMQYGSIIIVQTRWHFDDLVGYLLDKDKERLQRGDKFEPWTVLELPAIADSDDDILGRKTGEPIWPGNEIFSLQRLLDTKEAIGSREWNSQYMQKPLPEEGGMIHLDWFKRYGFGSAYSDEEKHIASFVVALKMNTGAKAPSFIKRIAISWDTAFKESELNDPSACTVWAVSDGKFYLLEVVNEHLGYPDLRKKILDVYKKYNESIRGSVPVLIEDKASGQSLIQDLRKTTHVPVIAIKADKNKQIRLSEVSALIEAGKVYIPNENSWVVDYETQMCQFPYSRHDDMVDSTSQFLRWAGKPRFKKSKTQKFWK